MDKIRVRSVLFFRKCFFLFKLTFPSWILFPLFYLLRGDICTTNYIDPIQIKASRAHLYDNIERESHSNS